MPRYTFHRCQPHAKCPDLTGWYLELHHDDTETMMRVHKGVCCLYFFKFGMDPHIEPDGPYNPIKLAAGWLASVERFMLTGETALVNSNGGMMPLDGTLVLETVESDDLHWNDRFEDERITISRWPQAKHYYLSSSKHRVFIPEKHNSLDEARREAQRYVPLGRICIKKCAGVLPPE